MMADEPDELRSTHILFQIIDIEGCRGIHSELLLCQLKNPWFGFHDSRLIGVDPVIKKRSEEVILLEDMIVVDAADIREEVEGGLSMERTGPFDHGGVHLKDPCPDFHEVIFRSVVGECFTDSSDEIFTGDPSRFMIDPQRMQILHRRRCIDAGMRHQRPLGNEVVEGQQDIPDVEDDGVDLRHGEEGGLFSNSGKQRDSCKVAFHIKNP